MDPLPTAKPSDAAHAVAKAVAGMVPGAGSALQVLMETVLAPPLERRKTRWLQQLAETVSELEMSVTGLTPEVLSQNEMFITAAAQATLLSLRTHQEEKLRALRNAVRHAALPNAPAEDLQLMFLRYVDELTPWHLRLLAYFQNPPLWMKRYGISDPGIHMGGPASHLEHCFPELHGKQEQYRQIVRDLQQRGLLQDGNFLNVMMTSSGIVAGRTTEFGNAFLSYIGE
mgnify:CR=1 FL=1